MAQSQIDEQESDLSLVGLEKVFVQIEQTEQSLNIANNREQIHELNEQSLDTVNIHEQVHELDGDSYELITMAEAARRLKMPYPTLRRQVLSGKVPSTPGPDGKPLVKLAISEQTANKSEHSSKVHEPETNKSEHSSLSSEHSATVQRLLAQIEAERNYSKALNEKLEAANYKNGYLEAQVDQQGEQIKLLTDSKHNRGRWHRFFSWFMGSAP